MKFMKVVSVAILIMLLSVVFTGCAIKMPIPSVEHAEFNFSITYEKDGVIKTYNGVYVCEFEGVHKSFYGESRDWKGYVKDVPDGEYSTIAIETVDEGTIYVDLGFFPEYFTVYPKFGYYLTVSDLGDSTIIGNNFFIMKNRGSSSDDT